MHAILLVLDDAVNTARLPYKQVAFPGSKNSGVPFLREFLGWAY